MRESRPTESGRSGSGTPQLGTFKQLRVVVYKFDPKLPHHPLHILRPEAISIRMFAGELTQAGDARIRIARVWRKGRIGWLMNDTAAE